MKTACFENHRIIQGKCWTNAFFSEKTPLWRSKGATLTRFSFRPKCPSNSGEFFVSIKTAMGACWQWPMNKSTSAVSLKLFRHEDQKFLIMSDFFSQLESSFSRAFLLYFNIRVRSKESNEEFFGPHSLFYDEVLRLGMFWGLDVHSFKKVRYFLDTFRPLLCLF